MKLFLYLKTHNVTGLKYLGQTKQDPFSYRGSGLKWVNHIKKYGNNVTTTILKECETYPELKEWGLYYSSLWNIVGSKEFANLTEENGNVTYTPKSKKTVIRKPSKWVTNGFANRLIPIEDDIPVGFNSGRTSYKVVSEDTKLKMSKSAHLRENKPKKKTVREFICDHCNIVFVRNYNAKYCSCECNAKARTTPHNPSGSNQYKKT